MKHLKKYKIFESKENNDEIVSYLNDVLVDVNDLGLVYELTFFNKNYTYFNKECDQSNPINRISIIIDGMGFHSGGANKFFQYSEISGCIDQINSFLQEKGFKQDPLYTNFKLEGFYLSTKNVSIDKLKKLEHNKIQHIYITFQKK
jgi:hypothetical protein